MPIIDSLIYREKMSLPISAFENEYSATTCSDKDNCEGMRSGITAVDLTTRSIFYRIE